MALKSEELLEYIRSRTPKARNAEEATALFSSSLLDSFRMVDIVLFVEKKCGIRIGPKDLTLSNFDSVERIIAFTSTKDDLHPR